METRKVQQTGGSTYIISLPKQWADRVGIKSGIRVGVQPQQDGKLLICPSIDIKQTKKKTINISNIVDLQLERIIIAAYLFGYSIIEFTSPKILSDQKKIIRTICYKLIGPEIIEENSTSVTVQDLLNPQDLSIKKAIQRMFLISNSMFRDSIRALKTCDLDLALDIEQRDDEVDRLFLVISKQFKLVFCGTNFIDVTETTIEKYHDLRMASTPIERIADHSQKIAHIILETKPKLENSVIKDIIIIGELIEKMLEISVEALFTSDGKLANEAIELLPELTKRINSLNNKIFNIFKNSSIEVLMSLRTIIDSISRIGDYSVNISEIAINSSVDSI